MIHDLSKMRIFVRPGSTDLRKAVNGLSILADSQMGKNPFEANLFLFSNADRKLLKALYWDRNGLSQFVPNYCRLRAFASGKNVLRKTVFPGRLVQRKRRKLPAISLPCYLQESTSGKHIRI